jgi:3-oxoacyl-[acyl-carrier-protein] synthase II
MPQRVERRVVVTGLGLVTPIGVGVGEVWKAALAGKSGVANITRFDAHLLPSRIAGEVKNFDPALYMDRKEARRNDLFIQFALAGAQLALQDAGLPIDKPLGDRVGVIVGSGMGGLATLEETHLIAVNKGFKRVSPFFIPAIIVNLASGQISIKHGAGGVNFAPVSACATGNHSIGESMRHLQHGDADVMICGGAEATITLLGISGFTQPRALSERNDEPTKASRPFDLGRDGFVPGEGAGILVLEELEYAKKRGARIYCEVTGYAATADAYHVTTPSGLGAERAMRLCLEDAGIGPRDVQYVNAHGTSTPVGDIAEIKAIKNVFGSYAKEGLLVSSTKSMTGHMLGAAGGVEAAMCALAIVNGVVHPTINVENQDPECDVDVVPNTAREVKVDIAISNSFGFGGTNAVIAMKKFEQ